jgi:hypothetical protein
MMRAMTREGGLVRWQWSLYPDGHRDRTNLLIHAFTVPLFLLGSVSLLLSPLLGWRMAFGAIGMIVAVAAQGRGHRREGTAPVPFLGPLDVVRRLFVEQWVTFPRYVLSGQFARAWRASR